MSKEELHGGEALRFLQSFRNSGLAIHIELRHKINLYESHPLSRETNVMPNVRPARDIFMEKVVAHDQHGHWKMPGPSKNWRLGNVRIISAIRGRQTAFARQFAHQQQTYWHSWSWKHLQGHPGEATTKVCFPESASVPVQTKHSIRSSSPFG